MKFNNPELEICLLEFDVITTSEDPGIPPEEGGIDSPKINF